MSKSKQRKRSLVRRLLELEHKMVSVATELDYYGGLNVQLVQHSKELLGASAIVATWREGLEAELAAKIPEKTA